MCPAGNPYFSILGVYVRDFANPQILSHSFDEPQILRLKFSDPKYCHTFWTITVVISL